MLPVVNRVVRSPWSDWEARPLSPNYNIGARIGEGKYGTVYKGVDKATGQVVALKKINTDKEANGYPQTALREITLLKRMQHQNIVSLREVVTRTTEDNKVVTYLVLEYSDHDLFSLRDKVNFTKAELRCLFSQVLNGLAYLHQQNIYHRDLKPNNILYNNDGCVKICDFGMANEYRRARPQTKRILVPSYRAPEIYLGQHYNCQVDVWSAGILFMELSQKRSPFAVAHSDAACFQQIISLCGTPDEESWPGVTSLPFYHELIKQPQQRALRKYMANNSQWDPLLVDLIDKMLTLNPAQRITAQAALQHEYFQNQVPIQMPRVESGRVVKEQPIAKHRKLNDSSYVNVIIGRKISKML